jgi:hypothetical protein
MTKQRALMGLLPDNTAAFKEDPDWFGHVDGIVLA